MRDNQEYQEQKLVVEYLELIGAKFTSIPNSTYTKSFAQKAINTASGLRSGLPDLFIIIKNKPFFIEMKRKVGGVTSRNQLDWITAINKCNGVCAYICNGFEEAKIIIDKYKNLCETK
jgi:hypothetical protein